MVGVSGGVKGGVISSRRWHLQHGGKLKQLVCRAGTRREAKWGQVSTGPGEGDCVSSNTCQF